MMRVAIVVLFVAGLARLLLIAGLSP